MVMRGWLGNPNQGYIPDWQTALGLMIGQGIASNVENKRVQGLTDFVANQAKTFNNVQPTDADTQAAQKEYAAKNGYADLIGQDGFQSLAGQQKLWQNLDAQKQQIAAKGDAMTDDDKTALAKIGQQQDILHRNAETVRAILKNRGIDITGFGADNDAEATLANRQNAQQSQETQQAQGAPTIGNKNATVETNPSTGQITVNRTSLLPPDGKITTGDIVKTAQQPNTTLSFADLAGGFGGNANDPTISALAKQLAQQRADTSFQPATFLAEVQRKAAQAGLSDEDYNRVMAQAGTLAAAKADQIKQEKNKVLLQNLAQQLQSTGNNTGAALVQFLVANGIKPADLAAHFPNADYENVDTGGTVYRMPKQGVGFGRTVGLQKTTNPDTVFNGKVSMTNNQNTNAANERNNIRTNTTSAANSVRSSNTTLTAKQMEINKDYVLKQMESRDKDKSLEAAKVVIQNYNDFEKTRLNNADNRPNPYADSIGAAQQILNNKMGVVDNATLKLQAAINSIYQQNGGDKDATMQWIDDHAAEIQNAGLDVGMAKSWVS